MKSIYLLVTFVCFINNVTAQKDTIIKSLYFYELLYHLKDGMGKPDSVVIQISPELIDSFHISELTIEHMINEANFSSENSLNEKISYEINHNEVFSLFRFKEKTGASTIVNIWYFIGQNMYGAKRSSKQFSTYDFSGNLISKYYMD